MPGICLVRSISTPLKAAFGRRPGCGRAQAPVLAGHNKDGALSRHCLRCGAPSPCRWIVRSPPGASRAATPSLCDSLRSLLTLRPLTKSWQLSGDGADLAQWLPHLRAAEVDPGGESIMIV
jgi:hypothetical protein